MRRVARLFLLWLVVAVLPLHGPAVAMSLRASTGAVPVASAVASTAGWSHAVEALPAMPAGHDHAQHAHQAHHAARAVAASHDGHAGHAFHGDACNACSACCSPAALPTWPVLASAEAAVPVHPSRTSAPPPVFLTDGPERPPRPPLA